MKKWIQFNSNVHPTLIYYCIISLNIIILSLEFYTRQVIDFLTTVQVPFVLPVEKHSRAMKNLLIGTKSRFAEYILHGILSLHLTITINVKYASGKRGKHGVENLGYVVHSIPWNPQRIHEIY